MVLERARTLAQGPYTPGLTLPKELSRLTYDAYREIRFRRERALWSDGSSDWTVHLFHPGFLFDRPVRINVREQARWRAIPFATDLFEYGKTPVPGALAPEFGFAGFLLTYPLNTPEKQDEVISFLGASYFRFLARSQTYGLSARALGLNIGGPTKEEFPAFREFWIERPEPGSNRATVLALLDSESLTGAYQFDIAPGSRTEIEVTATIFPRKELNKLALSPMSSMFLAGEGSRKSADDFRPEVHDSDGMLLQSQHGDWVWRPLNNPGWTSIENFPDTNPRGFGLLQRDRSFQHYEDLEAKYHARPSYWVTPIDDWGPGRIELVQIPAADETTDNIVLSWTPTNPPRAGSERRFRYRITALSDAEAIHPLGKVLNSFVISQPQPSGAPTGTAERTRFIVDFAGGDLAYHLASPELVEATGLASNGRVERTIVQANVPVSGFRVIMDVMRDTGQQTDVRLFLRRRARVLTETWALPWPSATPPPHDITYSIPHREMTRAWKSQGRIGWPIRAR
jgi:glucans biosynthesis protein